LRALAAWRVVAAAILAIALAAMTVRSADMLIHGSSRGIPSLFREMYVWAVMMALIVDWSARSPACARPLDIPRITIERGVDRDRLPSAPR
jgi:hypothetical protein